MKKISICILLSIFVIYACNSPKSMLVGKRYIATTPYDSMILYFRTQNECVFSHSFIPCGMDERFQKIDIVCNYKIKKNIITLSNKYPIDSLRNFSFITIPNDELQKCEYMNQYTISGRKPIPTNIFVTGAPPVYSNGFYIGFLNYIHKEELLYKDDFIFYQKETYKKHRILGNPIVMKYPERTKDGIFVQEGCHIDTLSLLEKFREASINMEIPWNYIEEK